RKRRSSSPSVRPAPSRMRIVRRFRITALIWLVAIDSYSVGVVRLLFLAPHRRERVPLELTNKHVLSNWLCGKWSGRWITHQKLFFSSIGKTEDKNHHQDRHDDGADSERRLQFAAGRAAQGAEQQIAEQHP